MAAEESRSAKYPQSSPYAQGWLEVGDGHSIYWEICGHPEGRPAVVLHGGPGSGVNSTWTELFNPAVYRVVLFDQRGCGRSKPSAARTVDALNANTTRHLIADIESLRRSTLRSTVGSCWGLPGVRCSGSRTLRCIRGRSASWFSSRSSRGRSARSSGPRGEWLGSSPRSGSAFRPGFRIASGTAISAPPITGCCLTPIRPCTSGRRGTGATGMTGRCALPGQAPSRRYEDPDFRLCSARLVTHYRSHGHFIDDGALARNAAHLAASRGS